MNPLPDSSELRRRVAERSRAFVEQELSLPPGAFSELGDGPVVEFAHTPHFGHLGFFRMLVHALAETARSGATLLLVFNDHVHANALPTIRHIPVSRGGIELDHPPSLGISKANRARPLCYVPSPTRSSLTKACESLKEILLFERASHPDAPSKKKIQSATADLFKSLVENAGMVSNYANWAIRSLLLILKAGEHGAAPICVIRSSDLAHAMPEHFAHSLTRREELATLLNDANAQSDPDWPEWSRPKSVRAGYFPAWILCDQCREDTDAVTIDGNRLNVRCRKHKWTHDLSDPSDGFRISPKVVLRQPLADFLGLEARVCGNRLGYWQIADSFSISLTGGNPVARHPVTGRVSFESRIAPVPGAPPLLRTFVELSIRDLVSQLSGPPDTDITVRVPEPADQNHEPEEQA